MLAQPRVNLDLGLVASLFAVTNAPMSTVDLRAKIRLLMALGELPAVLRWQRRPSPAKRYESRGSSSDNHTRGHA